jgi:SAM-dependent methyltransferase
MHMRLSARDVTLNVLAGFGSVRAPLRKFRDRRRPPDYEKIAAYTLDRLRVRREFIGDGRIAGSALLEIGSGQEFGLALLLLALGAKRIVNAELDSYRFIRDPGFYRLLIERASAARLPISWPPRGLVEARDGTVGPDPEWITLHLGRSASSIPEASDSIDVTFSVAVLEHIHRDAMPGVARELFRLTRPGGIGYHRVDLVDHYSRRANPFRFLGLTSTEYRLMYANRGSSSNRLRIDDIEHLYKKAGFSRVEHADVHRYEDLRQFEIWRKGFQEEFRDRDPDHLRATDFMLTLVK